jgi:hypothetical protein
VKKPVSKFAFQMQPAPLHHGAAEVADGDVIVTHGRALHVE